jgi:hypothetical protein
MKTARTKSSNGRLYTGDLVEVKTPDEILKTLDADGTLDHLPFMPEMVEFCGKRFHVSKRVVKTCFTGPNSSPRSFRGRDVVLLDDLRCSGAAHDGCQKSCMIFWREAWLRKVDDGDVSLNVDPESIQRLQSQLKTSMGPNRYFCQASELLKATNHLSRLQRYRSSFRDVREGNCNILEMLWRIVVCVFWKVRRLFIGEYHRGSNTTTPVKTLSLQPGESVEVESIENIMDTLNEKGCNRGLYFSPGMHLMCGKESRVMHRVGNIIMDGTGEMRRLPDTVRLEGSLCECPYLIVGGCSRGEISYWKEAWLRRAEPTSRHNVNT